MWVSESYVGHAGISCHPTHNCSWVDACVAKGGYPEIIAAFREAPPALVHDEGNVKVTLFRKPQRAIEQ